MDNIIVFDKPYPPEKMLEGLAVNWALVSGACNKCPYLSECENNDHFVFRADAACMVRKAALSERGGEDG